MKKVAEKCTFICFSCVYPCDIMVKNIIIKLQGSQNFNSQESDSIELTTYGTIEYIEKMLQQLNQISGLPIKLSDANVQKEDFDAIAKKALNDGAMLVNPKHVEYEDIIKILKKCL